MFKELEKINHRPEPYEFYTAEELWTNEHTAQCMLQYHLNESVDMSSRNRKFIEKSAAWIIDHFAVNKKSKIIDFGCGPGLYTTLFAESGAQVTGVDFSVNSINYAMGTAAAKKLDIEYIHANYLDFESDEKFDLITMIFCDFCALSPQQRAKLLDTFRSILKPNGHILLDVFTLQAFNKKKETATYEHNQLNGFWSADDYYGFLNSFKYEAEKVTLDKYTIIEQARTRAVYNWLHYYDQASIQTEAAASGFEIFEVFSDVAGTEYNSASEEMGVVLKAIK
ncbi:methyltransferase domain-containing protein [Lentisphaerota bacterium ZTH]|nr:methyltransferase domain-containing protein [Lentisphaerota bacterium]WET05944.1 methyltransferase domain-containing protein [Lentisphaerota bacterium ZTH]